MIEDILLETFCGVGALIYWLFKGCKTKLKDEIENHKIRNAITSIIISILVVVIIIKVIY